jgi:hypothetical protein
MQQVLNVNDLVADETLEEHTNQTYQPVLHVFVLQAQATIVPSIHHKPRRWLPLAEPHQCTDALSSFILIPQLKLYPSTPVLLTQYKSKV